MDIITFILLLGAFVAFVVAAAKQSFPFWIAVGLAAYMLALLIGRFNTVHLG